MADGVQQPGGAGTVITIQNNLHADADADGTLDIYSLRDVLLKGLASGDFIDLGTNASDPSYRCRANLQLGDAVGADATTWKDENLTLVMDSPRTFSGSSTGGTTRKIELGRKIQGVNGKPGGRNGIKLVSNGILTLRGHLLLYGCLFRTISASTLSLLPEGSNPSEIVNSILYSGAGFNLGISGTNPFTQIYNVELVSNTASGTLTVVSNWGGAQAERVTIEAETCGRFIQTAGLLRVRDLIFIGTPTECDIKFTLGVADRDLIEPTWSGNAPQVGAVNNTSILGEWWRFLPVVSGRRSGNPKLANVPVTLKDRYGNDIFGVQYTDSEGALSYNIFDATLSIFNNVIKVRRIVGTGAAFQPWEELGPFTARYNLDGVRRSDYLGETVEFNFPRVTGAYGDQLSPILEVVKLIPVGGGSTEEFRGAYA